MTDPWVLKRDKGIDGSLGGGHLLLLVTTALWVESLMAPPASQ